MTADNTKAGAFQAGMLTVLPPGGRLNRAALCHLEQELESGLWDPRGCSVRCARGHMLESWVDYSRLLTRWQRGHMLPQGEFSALYVIEYLRKRAFSRSPKKVRMLYQSVTKSSQLGLILR
jgi:hypothetical protein